MWEGFVLNLPAWMCTGFRDLPASKMRIYETAWNMHDRIGQAMEKPEQKAFLRKLIGVIGAPESEVGGHGGI